MKNQSSKLTMILLIGLVSMSVACGLGSRVTDLAQTPVPETAVTEPAPVTATLSAQPATPPPNASATTPPPDNPLPIDSVVQIWTLDENDDLLWSGSGSIISPDGYILTNAHVVLSDKYYTVYGLLVSLTVSEDEPPQLAYEAETVVVDEGLDLAVIRIVADVDGNLIEPETLDLPVMGLGNSDEVGLGSPLRILGYPGIGGETITLTSGEVAGFTNEPGVKGRAYIKTSATIAGGNSGGAGIDAQGRLIGVPTQLGYGGDDEIVDCRVLADTNGDGEVDSRDACVPTGGFINALRPINLAKPLIAQAFSGQQPAAQTEAESPQRSPISLPENPGATLFADDFSADDGQWQATDGLFITDGMLRLAVEASGDYRWTTITDEFEAADVQVETRKLSGPVDNSFGLIFRYQDADNFYSFEISSDGYYVVNKLEDGVWSPLIDWTESSVIDTQTGENQVAVVMQDDGYNFLVNGVKIGSLKDQTFSGGSIGLIASSYTEPEVLIGFDDLRVRTPGGSREMADPEETPQPGSIVFQDDFGAADDGWNTESDDQIRRGIQDDEFFIAVDDVQTDAWATHQTALGDVIIEVNAHKVAGPDTNNYGVMCRYQNAENYYFLQLGSDGTYAISRYLNGESTMLVDWTSSNLVNTGAASNLIRAECVGETLSLYANDMLLAGVTDTNLKYGQIALVAGTYDDAGVQINFDNLVVTRPDSATAGDPFFYDDFSTNEAGWPEEQNAEAAYFFSDGEYYLQVLETNYLVWSKMNETWGEVSIDVDTRQTDGPADNEYGLLCRYQDADNFYQIAISGDGYYRLARWVAGEFKEVIAWEGNSAINMAGESNHLSVVCAGNQIKLGINGHLLFDTTDDALPVDGDVALYVGTFDEGNVTVAFDDLIISNP